MTLFPGDPYAWPSATYVWKQPLYIYPEPNGPKGGLYPQATIVGVCARVYVRMCAYVCAFMTEHLSLGVCLCVEAIPVHLNI